ncbi:MAG: hypothetical protein FJ288_12215 [Planctomycetes bacterium]|nr:hypothetical protein [Planctomycetota bacterium]
MNRHAPHVAALVAAIAFLAGVAAAKPPLDIVTASYFAPADDGDLQGAAAAPDGTVYIAGNAGAPAKDLPGGVRPTTLGAPVKEPKCGCGFVAQLSADGRRLLRYAEFARGIVILTTVQANDQGVYVGGYASEGLEELLKDRPGLMRQYPLAREMQQIAADKAAGKEDKIAGRPGLGRYGAPCILRLSADLQKIESGTYLEGWQQVWDKKRVAKPGRELLGGYQEYYWQPTSIALLKGDDVLVCHDGGYFRLLTDKDRQLAAGNEKLLDRLSFYDCCDWVSRLSPDLARRTWNKPVYTPPVDPEVARRVKDGWPLPHYSSPRTHRMRVDKDENIYLCGWSASATANEPWWSPYLWKLDSRTGDAVWTAYQYDPMSGGGNRMGGTVSDTALLTVVPDDDGNLLTSLMADGGNTVMGWSPKADMSTRFEVPIKGKGFGVKLVHWWGQVHRVDSKARTGLGGARIGPWGWVVDMAALPGRNVLAVGRFNGKFDFTDDAWAKESPIDNPNAFLRVFSPEFDLMFSTEIPGLVPFEITRLSPTRVILVGRAEKGAAPAKDAIQAKSPGQTDGYFMVLDWKAGTGEKN